MVGWELYNEISVSGTHRLHYSPCTVPCRRGCCSHLVYLLAILLQALIVVCRNSVLVALEEPNIASTYLLRTDPDQLLLGTFHCMHDSRQWRYPSIPTVPISSLNIPRKTGAVGQVTFTITKIIPFAREKTVVQTQWTRVNYLLSHC